MKNLTLHFPSLESLEAFAHQLDAGYAMNKRTLTITAKLLDSQFIFAARIFGAQLVDSNYTCRDEQKDVETAKAF